MKDELKKKSKQWSSFDKVRIDIDDWIDYYNNERYKMGLDKLSPNEYYQYIMTGKYPLQMNN